MSNQGIEIVKVRDSLKSQRSMMDNHWNQISPFATPFDTVYSVGYGDMVDMDQRFTSALIFAIQTCVNGLASLIFPREQEFVEFSTPTALRQDDDAVRWVRQCSEVHQIYLQSSNFWEENDEMLNDLVAYGTGCLFIGGLDEATDELYFRHIPIGTYYITEDSKGRVNALYRDLEYTADQAAQEYGEDKLPQEIRSKVGKATGATDKYTFIHAVYPRKERKTGKKAPKLEKAFASCVVYEKTKELVHEDGFDDFPFAVIRFRKIRRSVYGFGPGWLALGDTRQLAKLEQLSDVATEITVFPPSEAPAYMEGEVTFAALGINYRSDQDSIGIRQLPINNRLDQTNVRMDQKRQLIDQACFVDLFTMLSRQASMPGSITAYQAAEMVSEKMTQFSPVYGRIISEGGDVIMRRNFSSLYKAGKFPDPPESMLDVDSQGKVIGTAVPSVSYKNKIVLLQQYRNNSKVMEFFNMVLPILQAVPEFSSMISAGLQIPEMFRDIARNLGFPEGWIKTKEAMDAILAAMAQAADQERQAAMMEQGSKTLANVGKAPPQLVEATASAL